MDVTRKYHPEWGKPIPREHIRYVLTDKWKLAQKLRIPKIHMKLKKKEDQSVNTSILLRRRKNTQGRKYRCKVWSKDWKKGHPETAPPGDPSCIQSLNTDTIVDAKKCMLTRAWYSCPLRDSARAWEIQRLILAANHRTENWVPSWGVRDRTEGT